MGPPENYFLSLTSCFTEVIKSGMKHLQRVVGHCDRHDGERFGLQRYVRLGVAILKNRDETLYTLFGVVI